MSKASAWLFSNGAALFFDEEGQQIVDLQKKRLCGLHEFVKRYPDAPAYWAVWKGGDVGWAWTLPPSSIPWLLQCIRKRPGPRPEMKRDNGG